MKAANQLPDYPENLKTKRQWADLGLLPVDDNAGEQYWTNRNCQHRSIYYRRDQVREATQEELDAYYIPIKQAKAERRRIKKECEEKKRAEQAERERIEAERQKAIEEQRKALKKVWEKYAEVANNPCIACENPSGIVVFDVETTGLDSEEDEILQVSIIDGEGHTLINSYVKPHVKTEWLDAMAINGITPQMVEDAPYAEELIPLVNGIFKSADIGIAYNNNFDLGFLAKWGIKDFPERQIDVMYAFAQIYGEWSDYFGDYKWQKLVTAASYYGYDFDAHDSLEDVKATLCIYNEMNKNK